MKKGQLAQDFVVSMPLDAMQMVKKDASPVNYAKQFAQRKQLQLKLKSALTEVAAPLNMILIC
jgi:hypothetical protein